MAKELSMRKIHEILRLHYEHGLSSRQGTGATLITSQYAPSHWHEIIGDATVADAILDRLVHGAYRIDLQGESMRRGRAARSPGDVTKKPDGQPGKARTAQ